jgi:thiol-disulfide isomerase/thioredoxin
MYAKYGKFGKKEASIKGNVLEIESSEHKESILEESKISGQLVVVDIWGSFCGPCKACRPAYEGLSLKYPSVVFCGEDVTLEITPEATVVPWFQFYGQGYLLENVKGADMGIIEKTILKYLQSKPENHQEPSNSRQSFIGTRNKNPNINRNGPQQNYDIHRRTPHGIRK